jgi:hypothetical protein
LFGCHASQEPLEFRKYCREGQPSKASVPTTALSAFLPKKPTADIGKSTRWGGMQSWSSRGAFGEFLMQDRAITRYHPLHQKRTVIAIERVPLDAARNQWWTDDVT